MPAYFTCPKCHQKNYGQKHVPVANVIRGVRCTRCGLTEISWVAEGFGEAARAQLGPKAQIAVGVHESEIEWLGPDVASPRDQGILKRLEPSSSCKTPYSQGELTKNFSPGTQAIKEGICEGQCLHWIRRVLQGGTEDYKPKSEGVSDKELVLKQKRQHTVGAVGQILTAKIVERQKKATSQHAVAKAAENLALRNLQAEKDQASAKFDAALGKLGFVRQGDEWKPKLSEMPKKEWDALQKDFAEAMQKWKQIEEVFAAKARAISAQFITKADAARQSAMALENGLYGDGWQELAKQLDSWIDQKVKV